MKIAILLSFVLALMFSIFTFNKNQIEYKKTAKQIDVSEPKTLNNFNSNEIQKISHFSKDKIEKEVINLKRKIKIYQFKNYEEFSKVELADFYKLNHEYVVLKKELIKRKYNL